MNRILLVLLYLSLASFLSKDSGGFLKINGKSEYILRKGNGTPAVVFVTGIGATSDNFSEIQSSISKLTLTISYDKAGLGKSETMGTERSLDNMAAELDSILIKESVTAPCILVGHSRGGLLLRYFANKYPEKVAGLILIDPSSIEALQKKRAIRSREDRVTYDSINKLTYKDASANETANEFKNFYLTDTLLLKGIYFSTSLPITIIASTKKSKEKYGNMDTDIKIDLYKSWIQKSPQVKLVLTDKASHSIHNEQPKLVIDEITSMYNKLSGH